MNDDWRLRIELADREQAGQLTERLKGHTAAEERTRSIHDRIVVSQDGVEVFCYAGTREQAQATQRAIEQLVTDHAWNATYELRHWHPTAEQWEDADVPLPSTDAERAQERQRRVAQERADSESQGYPEFEVRVQCSSRAEAVELAERLRETGISVVQRWSAVLLGASDEASAEQLAEGLRGQAPPSSTVSVEGNLRAIYDERPWRPFSVLGGMGG